MKNEIKSIVRYVVYWQIDGNPFHQVFENISDMYKKGYKLRNGFESYKITNIKYYRQTTYQEELNSNSSQFNV